MADNRTQKMEAIITREAAIFFEREGNRNSLITVTRTALTKRGNGATLFVSVFPEDKEKAAMDFIHRHLGDLRRHLQEKIRSKSIPSLRVIADYGERSREEITRLLLEE